MDGRRSHSRRSTSGVPPSLKGGEGRVILSSVKGAFRLTFQFLLFFLFFLLAFLSFSYFFVPQVPGILFSPFAHQMTEALLLAEIGALCLVLAFMRKHLQGFRMAYFSVLVTASLLLLLSFPLLVTNTFSPVEQISPSQHFWQLDGNERLYVPTQHREGQFLRNVVLIPKTSPMRVVEQVQYDPWNKRFIYAGSQGTGQWHPSSAEAKLYQEPALLSSLQDDLFWVYSALKTAYKTDPGAYALLSVLYIGLFLGLAPFFLTIRWAFVRWILALLAARLYLALAAFSVSGVPSILQQWFPAMSLSNPLIGIAILALAVLGLFFLTMALSRPTQEVT